MRAYEVTDTTTRGTVTTTSDNDSVTTADESGEVPGLENGATVDRASDQDETAIDSQNTTFRAAPGGSVSATQFTSGLTRTGSSHDIVTDAEGTSSETASSRRHESGAGRRDESARMVVRGVAGEPDQTDRTTLSRASSGSTGRITIADESSHTVSDSEGVTVLSY